MESYADATRGHHDETPAAGAPTPYGSGSPNLNAATNRSRVEMKRLATLASGLFTTDETAFVVFGSLARGEFTSGSDVDWAVLIDGRAEADHVTVVHELHKRLENEKFIQPGQTGVFGDMVFSHGLIHEIGGDDDTNTNMTRRLLMLLESDAVSVGESAKVRERVLRVILDRYLEEDAGYLARTSEQMKIPRFLLNDIVRLWRTMAVDFASKNRVRQRKGWALRNIKLRMSRKLLLLSGLLMCISWAMKPPIATAADDREMKDALIEHLLEWVSRQPLGSIKQFVEAHAPAVASRIFEPYDSFLGLLGDDAKRLELKELRSEAAYENRTFLEARELSERFDTALIELLFDSNKKVADLTKKYGVF
jgi:predicted nucleotidyltransferase